MSAIPWIIISIGVLLIVSAVLAAFMFVRRKEYKRETDYYTFFVMGVIFLPVGIAFRILSSENPIGIVFTAMGVIYLILGLSNKKDWKKNHKTFKQLSKKEKKFKIIVSIVLGIIILAAAVAYFLFG